VTTLKFTTFLPSRWWVGSGGGGGGLGSDNA
jgi:hypothetical protein